MNFPFFQKQTKQQPLTKVSMRYASTKEEVHEELCKLAWQMTCRNASYADARDVLQEGKVFPIPKDEYAQLDVRDFRVYGEDHYFPDDEEGTPSIVLTKGKLLGCIYEGKKGVTDLADRDDAHEFIERLEQVYKMWSDVEAGKKLPEEEPKKEDKKKSDEKGAKKEEKTGGTDQEKKEEDSNDEQLAKFPKTPLRDLYAELTDDETVAQLQETPRTERNKIFTGMKKEYDDAVEKLQEYLQEFVGDLEYLATLINELNGNTKSPAKKFLEELEAQRKAAEEEEQETEQKKKSSEEKKPEFTEEEMHKRKNFIRRHKGKVRSLTRQLEEEDNVDDLLELLDEMEILLNKGDIEGYKELKDKFDAYRSADQQTNPHEDSSKGGNGKDEKGSDDKKSDDSSEEPGNKKNPDGEEPDNGEDDEEQQEETSNDSNNSNDNEYTIEDAILMLQLAGYEEIPKPIRLFAPERKISASSLKQVLKTCGITDVNF